MDTDYVKPEDQHHIEIDVYIDALRVHCVTCNVPVAGVDADDDYAAEMTWTELQKKVKDHINGLRPEIDIPYNGRLEVVVP
jgi:hypothetical protein